MEWGRRRAPMTIMSAPELAVTRASATEPTRATRSVTVRPGKSRRTSATSRAVAAAWGEALGESEKHVDDAGLAATARMHGLIVVTRNVKDFDGRGVKVIDPFKPAHRRA